jgi:hypothetical protein
MHLSRTKEGKLRYRSRFQKPLSNMYKNEIILFFKLVDIIDKHTPKTDDDCVELIKNNFSKRDVERFLENYSEYNILD